MPSSARGEGSAPFIARESFAGQHLPDATGVLILDRVTPVISRCSAPFASMRAIPATGGLYRSPRRDQRSAMERRARRSADAGRSARSARTGRRRRRDGEDRDAELSMPALIDLIAPHFGADQNQDLANLIEHHPFEGSADLDALFLIATCFDDSHHLVAIQLEGCWRCSRHGFSSSAGMVASSAAS